MKGKERKGHIYKPQLNIYNLKSSKISEWHTRLQALQENQSLKKKERTHPVQKVPHQPRQTDREKFSSNLWGEIFHWIFRMSFIALPGSCVQRNVAASISLSHILGFLPSPHPHQTSTLEDRHYLTLLFTLTPPTCTSMCQWDDFNVDTDAPG